jgi:hypothetical protein
LRRAFTTDFLVIGSAPYLISCSGSKHSRGRQRLESERHQPQAREHGP